MIRAVDACGSIAPIAPRIWRLIPETASAMTIIKNRQADRLIHDAVVLDLGDLKRQADAIITDAKRHAERIIADGRAEAKGLSDGAADKGYDAGFQRGLDEGREQGRKEGRAEAIETHREQFEQLGGAWSSALESWEQQRRDMLLAAREDVLEFAITMARKIVHRVAARDPEVVRDQLAAALDRLSRPSAVTVTIHPRDRGLLEPMVPDLLDQFQKCREIVLKEDERIEPGGCVVTTAAGEIDAQLDTQIERIAEALLPARSRDDDHPDE